MDTYNQRVGESIDMEYGTMNVEMRQRSRSTGGSVAAYTRLSLEDDDFETVPTLAVHSRVHEAIPKPKYALCKLSFFFT